MRLLSNKEESLGKVIASTHLAISAFIRLQHERIIITSDCISWLAAQASVWVRYSKNALNLKIETMFIVRSSLPSEVPSRGIPY